MSEFRLEVASWDEDQRLSFVSLANRSADTALDAASAAAGQRLNRSGKPQDLWGRAWLPGEAPHCFYRPPQPDSHTALEMLRRISR